MQKAGRVGVWGGGGAAGAERASAAQFCPSDHPHRISCCTQPRCAYRKQMHPPLILFCPCSQMQYINIITSWDEKGRSGNRFDLVPFNKNKSFTQLQDGRIVFRFRKPSDVCYFITMRILIQIIKEKPLCSAGTSDNI